MHSEVDGDALIRPRARRVGRVVGLLHAENARAPERPCRCRCCPGWRRRSCRRCRCRSWLALWSAPLPVSVTGSGVRLATPESPSRAGEVDGDALIRPRARRVGRVVGLLHAENARPGSTLSMSMLPWLAAVGVAGVVGAGRARALVGAAAGERDRVGVRLATPESPSVQAEVDGDALIRPRARRIGRVVGLLHAQNARHRSDLVDVDVALARAVGVAGVVGAGRARALILPLPVS